MRRPTAIVLLLALAAPARAEGDATLASGGFARAEGLRLGGPKVADGALALRDRLLDVRPGPLPAPRPQALGDSLVVRYDDGVVPILQDWEARLDVSGAAAGPSDAIAVRFPSSLLATAPPFSVSPVIGLDDRHGIADWDVELWLEDAAQPLQPRRGAVSAAGTLDASAVGLTATDAPRPTDFALVPVPISLDVVPSWLSDGAFDDDFERSAVPLGDGQWVECEDATCGSLNVFLDGTSAVRQTGGGALLAVRFPDTAVEAQRPHRDLDVRASVRVRESAAGFRSAGLALRVVASDAYYRVEVQRTPAQVVVSAVLPAPIGVVPLGAPLPIATPSSGSRLLEVTTTDVAGGVRLDVSVDGVSVGTVTDTTHRLGGWYAGLSASDPAGTGEAWDDFRVERRPDVFVVVGFPPGSDAGLPLDVSGDSVDWSAILTSTDGVAFAPPATPAGCFHAGNPYVHLVVTDDVTGTQLRQREARVAAVSVTCPTCPQGPSSCPRDLGLSGITVPALTVGEPATARVTWWNEQLADDTVIFRTTLWSGPCAAVGSIVATGDVSGVASPPQAPGAPLEIDVLTFLPADPGPHCLAVEVLHDSNGDCCPDGEETVPLGGCGAACTPVAASDGNPGTRLTVAELAFSAPCALPKGEDVGRDGPDDFNADGVPDEINLDGGSLRVSKGAADEVVLDWARNDLLVFPATYNIHLVREDTFVRERCFLEQAPVVLQVVGGTSARIDLPARPGAAAWVSVHETDGCAAQASVPDDSEDDPSLACP